MPGPFTSIRDRDLDALARHLADERGRQALLERRVRGLSALHLAVREAWVEGVECLLDAGCDIDARDDEGQTPLHHAAYDGRFVDCSWLLMDEQPGDERDELGKLIDRPEPGRSVAFPKDPVVGTAIARILHRRGVLKASKLPEAWSPESVQLAEAFHHATWSDDARRRLLEELESKLSLDEMAPQLKAQLARPWPFDEVARRLIGRGANLDAEDRHRQTPLHVAVQNGAVQNGAPRLVELLIDAGAELDAEDEWQETPLYHAAEAGHLESARALLRAGALPIGALQPAAAAGHVEILRALIDAGADVEESDNTKEEPLLAAARYGHDEAIELLLAAGASPQVRDYCGDSALHLAVDAYAPAPVIERLARACGVNARGEDDRTPLHAAATAVNAPAVSQLLSLGADASLQARGGVSPLHAFFDDLDAFKVADAARLLRQLVKAGCDPSRADRAGRIPRELGVHFDEPIRKALGSESSPGDTTSTKG